MPRTKVNSSTRRIENMRNFVPVNYNDPIGSLPEEIRPRTVRNRIIGAKNGYLGGLHVLYKQMTTDARYAGISNSLRSSVALCPLNISPGKKKSRSSKLAYNLVREQLNGINKSRLIKQMTAPYFMGAYVAALNWKIRPTSHASNDAAWFTGLTSLDPSRLYVGVNPEVEEEYQKLLVASKDFPEGIPVTNFEKGSIIWADDGDTDEGYYHLAGAARRCLGWWLGKQYTQSYWSEFNETFAEPLRVAYVDPNASNKERRQLERFLKFMGRNMYGIFDNDVDIDLMESQKMGTVTTFQQFINLANDEMSIGLTGEIESSGSGNKFGSNAKAKTHLKVRSNVVGSVVEDTNEQLKEVVGHIVSFNIDDEMDPDEIPTAVLQIPRPEDKLTLSEFYDNVTKYVPVSVEQIRRDLELRNPEDEEETIGPEDRNIGPESPSTNNQVPPKTKTEEDRQSGGKGSKETGN